MTSIDATDIAIVAEGLVKTFGTTRAVDGVDLRVDRGTVYGVLGPNGAGKTTTISMLTTLLRPDGGRASIFGHDVIDEPDVVRQLIGVTGQDASVDEKISGIENMVVFGRLLGLGRQGAKRRGLDLLDAFGLAEAATRPVAKYSGGMRRRLDLASSLIAQPPLIFLDEPTTGLDPRTRGQMWDVIRDLVANGSTVLLTTQYLDEADHLADRIAVIDRGRVVAEGTANDLKALVGTATLQLALADAAVTDAALATTEHVLGTRASATPERGHITAPMADPERITDLLIALRTQGIRLAEVSVERPTLDEVFMTITGHGTADPQTEITGKVAA
ncbi:ATP-binding cassette domain-containing protein [Propionicicella superfundia]|uniref:ATP-binding cassette domain-containing protein n=1 Tax=Propionicicella superfundia TaxID=348582 RepID=UPI000426CF3B